MDPSFFGLDGHPFDSTPDGDAPYVADTHASLIAELRAGLKAPHGITLVIGEEGTGKTSLIRKFAEDSSESCTVAYLPTTGPGLRHLLTETIEQLGGSPPSAGDEQALLDALASLARARAAHGRTTLVVVDDAHELPAKTIERVGRLFGDDPADPSMLHVVLVGRPELLDRMNAANDRTILKHLVQVCRMDPIGPEESFRYIADRIAKVGGIVDKLFTEDALRLIVKRANGNPGRIDAICSAALEQAAESGTVAVAADAVDIACIGVESFTIDASNGKAAEKDPMQYIFGEEEMENEDSRVARRLRGSGSENGTRDAQPEPKALPAPKPLRATGATAMLSDAASAVREQLAVTTDNRKRLGIWAVGLVVLLVGFAATMTRTGERGQATADKSEPTTLASAERSAPQAALPATAVRTSKLIVKREGEGEPATPQPAGAAPSEPAAAPKPEPPAAAQPGEGSQPSVAQQASAPPAKPAATTQPASPASPQVVPSPAPAAAAPAPAAAPPAPVQAPATGSASVKQVTPLPPVTSAQLQPKAVAPQPPAAAKPSDTKPLAPVVAAASKPAAPTAAPAAPLAAAPTKLASTTSPPSAAPAAAPAGAKYTVQLGAFKSRENADSLVEKVRKSYPDARVVVAQAGATSVFRVVSGAFASKADADTRAKTLAGHGFTTFVRDIEK